MGLAKQGNDVNLLILSKDADKASIDDIFKFYRMKRIFEIRRLPTINWNRKTQTWSFCLLAILYVALHTLFHGKPDFVYMRGVTVVCTFLIVSKILEISVFYETYKLGSEVVRYAHNVVAIENKKSEGFLRRVRMEEDFILKNMTGLVLFRNRVRQSS